MQPLNIIDAPFHERRSPDPRKDSDWRSEYGRDKARIVHGAAFRRLQGKTQVMGVGEGDFHRTRLTHSLEVAQIGLGLLEGLKQNKLAALPHSLKAFLDVEGGRDIIAASCYAHDLGHPPFGHGGERALHKEVVEYGGFEGNAQTVRIVTKLERYHVRHKGINPSRRFLLSILKYPAAYTAYHGKVSGNEPPKCYYDCHVDEIAWALEPFCSSDTNEFSKIFEVKPGKFKTKHMTFDASVMNCADDIAYCSHDLEDIVARRIVEKDELLEKIDAFFRKHGPITVKDCVLNFAFFACLYEDGYQRKDIIGKLVNSLMNSVTIVEYQEFEHPLLRYRLEINEEVSTFTEYLKKEVTYNLVVGLPKLQMLERKGQHIISRIYNELKLNPRELIHSWEEFDGDDSPQRRVCDYVAGMTDSYAVRLYNRLFTPGFGTTTDEL